MKKTTDANDTLRNRGRAGLSIGAAVPMPGDNGQADIPSMPVPMTATKLIAAYPALRDPVIHGLLRSGETMNLIAPPKTGKSWLTLDLALSVASGSPWLGHIVAQGDVLLLDNELHPETIADRIPRVATARKIDLSAVGDRIHVMALRGRLRDLRDLAEWLDVNAADGRYRIVVIDAWYRTIPIDKDENSNGDIARLYDRLDAVGATTGSAFVCVHHASKGDQSGKSVTDVGSGAGSMSRCVDAHVVMRRHAEDGCSVMEAAVRSWPRATPIVLRWDFPTWTIAEGLDPFDLATTARRKAAAKTAAPDPLKGMTPETWVKATFASGPKSRARVEQEALDAGLPLSAVHRFLRLAIEGKTLFPRELDGGIGYSTTAPELPLAAPPKPSNRDLARQALTTAWEKAGSPKNGVPKLGIMQALIAIDGTGTFSEDTLVRLLKEMGFTLPGKAGKHHERRFHPDPSSLRKPSACGDVAERSKARRRKK